MALPPSDVGLLAKDVLASGRCVLDLPETGSAGSPKGQECSRVELAVGEGRKQWHRGRGGGRWGVEPSCLSTEAGEGAAAGGDGGAGGAGTTQSRQFSSRTRCHTLLGQGRWVKGLGRRAKGVAALLRPPAPLMPLLRGARITFHEGGACDNTRLLVLSNREKGGRGSRPSPAAPPPGWPKGRRRGACKQGGYT